MTKRFTINGKEIIQDKQVWCMANSEHCADVIATAMNELYEENEQLKSSDTITDLETEIMNLKTTIQQLRTDNTKQKKKLNTAMKENEQLKCGNKNLKATLNDFINILNRLQSNPNNEQTLNVARDMLQNMGKELEE
jgi:regulator of replication initiation timing